MTTIKLRKFELLRLQVKWKYHGLNQNFLHQMYTLQTTYIFVIFLNGRF